MKHIYLLSLSLLILWGCTTENNPTFKLTVTASPTEGGSFTPSESTFDKNEEVTLTATPSNGWQFVRWEVDWSGTTNPITLRMTRDYSITGVFERKNYALNVTVEGQGSVTETVIPQKSTDYPFQTVVQLTPVPAEGWRFVEWGGDLTGSEAPKTISVDNEKNVTARFTRINSLIVTIKGEGTVTERIVTSKTTDFPLGTVIELTPVAAQDWVFAEWSNDLNGTQNPEKITITGPKAVVAWFIPSGNSSTLTRRVSSDGGWNAAILNENSLWVWTGSTPKRVGTDNDWAMVSTNRTSSFALKTDGTLWRISHNTTPTATRVGNDSDWTMISAAGVNAVALKTDRSLWTWGSNGHGQLGYAGGSSSPQRVGTRNDWILVAAGAYSTHMIDSEYKLWVTGRNISGDIGLGTSPDVSTPTLIQSSRWREVSGGDFHSLALQVDGTMHRTGAGSGSRTMVGFSDFKWRTAVAGRHQSHAIRDDGTLWVWRSGEGFNSDPLVFQQFDTNNDWVDIAPGWGNSIGMRSDGSVWLWQHKNCGSTPCTAQRMNFDL